MRTKDIQEVLEHDPYTEFTLGGRREGTKVLVLEVGGWHLSGSSWNRRAIRSAAGKGVAVAVAHTRNGETTWSPNVVRPQDVGCVWSVHEIRVQQRIAEQRRILAERSAAEQARALHRQNVNARLEALELGVPGGLYVDSALRYSVPSLTLDKLLALAELGAQVASAERQDAR